MVPLSGYILPLFQQITTLIYNHWIQTFVYYWNGKNASILSKRKSICKRCQNCYECKTHTICVFCSKNAENLDEIYILKKNADSVTSLSKIVIASTENTLMPMIQGCIEFMPKFNSKFNSISLKY